MNAQDTYIESRYDSRPKRRGKSSFGFGGDFENDIGDDGFDRGFDFGGFEDSSGFGDFPDDFSFSGIGAGGPGGSPVGRGTWGEYDPTTGDLGTIPDPLTTIPISEWNTTSFGRESDAAMGEWQGIDDNPGWALGNSPDWGAESSSTRSTVPRSASGGGIGGSRDSGGGTNWGNIIGGIIGGVRSVIDGDNGSNGSRSIPRPSSGRTPPYVPSRTMRNTGSGGGNAIPASRSGIPGAGNRRLLDSFTGDSPTMLLFVGLGALALLLFLRRK